jgi:hypothetical protein
MTETEQPRKTQKHIQGNGINGKDRERHKHVRIVHAKYLRVKGQDHEQN